MLSKESPGDLNNLVVDLQERPHSCKFVERHMPLAKHLLIDIYGECVENLLLSDLLLKLAEGMRPKEVVDRFRRCCWTHTPFPRFLFSPPLYPAFAVCPVFLEILFVINAEKY